MGGAYIGSQVKGTDSGGAVVGAGVGAVVGGVTGKVTSNLLPGNVSKPVRDTFEAVTGSAVSEHLSQELSGENK